MPRRAARWRASRFVAGPWWGAEERKVHKITEGVALLEAAGSRVEIALGCREGLHHHIQICESITLEVELRAGQGHRQS